MAMARAKRKVVGGQSQNAGRTGACAAAGASLAIVAAGIAACVQVAALSSSPDAPPAVATHRPPVARSSCILGNPAEFACQYLISVRALSSHVFNAGSEASSLAVQPISPSPSEGETVPHGLQQYSSRLAEGDTLTRLAQLARRIDDHLAALVARGEVPWHGGYVSDAFNGRSAAVVFSESRIGP